MRRDELQLITRRYFFQQSGFGIGSLALASLANEPKQIPALLGLAGETATALWTLYRAGRALGPALRAP